MVFFTSTMVLPPVEKRINRVDITILLHHNPLELDGRNRHLSATLGKEHILPPYHRTVPAPIVLFHFQALLLGQLYFLRMKASKSGMPPANCDRLTKE